MNEMIERVAGAIYEKRNGHGAKAFRSQPLAHREPYYTDAYAAVSAMREPTEKMWTAGEDEFDLMDAHWAKKLWNRMIDEALK